MASLMSRKPWLVPFLQGPPPPTLSACSSTLGLCTSVLSCLSHVQLFVSPWTVAHQTSGVPQASDFMVLQTSWGSSGKNAGVGTGPRKWCGCPCLWRPQRRSSWFIFFTPHLSTCFLASSSRMCYLLPPYLLLLPCSLHNLPPLLSVFYTWTYNLFSSPVLFYYYF